MTKITVLILAPATSRLLASTCEREIALKAESVLDSIAMSALPVPVWIHCTDAAIRGRLADYLSGLQDELALGAPA